MLEQLEPALPPSLEERIQRSPGLAPLLAEAKFTWRARAAAEGIQEADGSDSNRPGWRTFEDAFPTFYEFTNRPR